MLVLILSCRASLHSAELNRLGEARRRLGDLEARRRLGDLEERRRLGDLGERRRLGDR